MKQHAEYDERMDLAQVFPGHPNTLKCALALHMNTQKTPPCISVVMSVYNGESSLGPTIHSILQQSFPNFEFLIVDDGSTDNSLSILRRFEAEDPRVRVIAQQNLGLTAALNVGCAQAVAPIIARQDVGDISHPGRLREQLEYLSENLGVVAVGCGARRITSENEFLGEVQRRLEPVEVTRQLLECGTGIIHAASIFRRESFEKAGRYRQEFRYAQDFDLWLRLTDVGLIGECNNVLYDVLIDDCGISAARGDQQVMLWKLARECHAARSCGESECSFLEQANRISTIEATATDRKAISRQRRRARYFIGSQLLLQQDAACRKYFVQSIPDRNLFLPSLYKLAQSFSSCYSKPKVSAWQ